MIRHASTSYSRHLGTSGESVVVSSSASQNTGTNTGTGDETHSESASSKSETMLSPSGSASVGPGINAPSPLHLPNGMSSGSAQGSLGQGNVSGWGVGSGSPGGASPADSPRMLSISSGNSTSPPVTASDGLRRVALGPTSRRARTHAVVVVGPPG